MRFFGSTPPAGRASIADPVEGAAEGCNNGKAPAVCDGRGLFRQADKRQRVSLPLPDVLLEPLEPLLPLPLVPVLPLLPLVPVLPLDPLPPPELLLVPVLPPAWEVVSDCVE